MPFGDRPKNLVEIPGITHTDPYLYSIMKKSLNGESLQLELRTVRTISR